MSVQKERSFYFANRIYFLPELNSASLRKHRSFPISLQSLRQRDVEAEHGSGRRGFPSHAHHRIQSALLHLSRPHQTDPGPGNNKWRSAPKERKQLIQELLYHGQTGLTGCCTVKHTWFMWCRFNEKWHKLTSNQDLAAESTMNYSAVQGLKNKKKVVIPQMLRFIDSQAC